MIDDAYGLLQEGRKLLEEGRPHHAAVLLEKAATLEPQKLSIRETLARAFFNSGQMTRATQEFMVMVEQDPANDYGHFGLGLCLKRTGDFTRARAHLKLAVALRPNVEAYQQALTAVIA